MRRSVLQILDKKICQTARATASRQVLLSCSRKIFSHSSVNTASGKHDSCCCVNTVCLVLHSSGCHEQACNLYVITVTPAFSCNPHTHTNTSAAKKEANSSRYFRNICTLSEKLVHLFFLHCWTGSHSECERTSFNTQKSTCFTV